MAKSTSKSKSKGKSGAGGARTIIPQLVFKDSRKAIAFYKKALGAKETMVMPWPDGKRVMHAQIVIGDATVMMSDENPPHSRSAEAMGGSAVSFYLYVDDVDKTFKKAVAAGAVARMPVADMFWGDRSGTVTDPFGYMWMLATRQHGVTKKEMAAGAKKMFAEMKM